MKTYITLILLAAFTLSVNAATKLIIAEKVVDTNGTHVSIKRYSNADGSFLSKDVSTASFLTKLAALANKNITGFARNSDRILIRFNDDGTLHSIDFHVVSSNTSEPLQTIAIKAADLPAQTVTDVTTFQTAADALQ